jgi:hypothetical protein
VMAPSTKSLILGGDGDDVGEPFGNSKALFMFFVVNDTFMVDFSKIGIDEDVVDSPPNKGPVRSLICSPSPLKSIQNFGN